MFITALAFVMTFPALFRGLRNNFYGLHGLFVLLIAGAIEFLIPGIEIFSQPAIIISLILHLIFINFVTFMAYASDKKAARNRSWRIPERTMHAFMFVGGTLGAIAGQKLLRHKTRKKNFRLKFWFLLIVQVGVVLWLMSL